MRKIFIAILLFSGITLSQVTQEEQIKNTLIDMTIRWNEVVKTYENLTQNTNILIEELQAIQNPSEELIAIMKKYQIYKEPDVLE